MKPRTNAGLAVLLFTILVTVAMAQTADKPESQYSVARPAIEKVPLTEVLDAVDRNSKTTFLISRHVPPEIVVGSVSVSDVDYATLLQILRNNDLAAANVDGVVNVIPVGIVRQYPLPMLTNDSSMHDEEWVTGIIQLENAPAASMMPIMRPMMPQAGHLAANPKSNSVIIVDRLGNAKRIFAMIRQLDQDTPEQSE